MLYSNLLKNIGFTYDGYDNYDNMNCLTVWNVYFNNSLQQNNSLSYNVNTGNIYRKSNLGDYAVNYGANGKPHALTSIAGVPGSFQQTI